MGNSGKLPVIFSFTCLTGFFESAFYRSLGEEFVRYGKNGAICFYGASSYTSQEGNIIMNRILLDYAVNGEFESLGELLWLTEMNMLIRYGASQLPLIRQYNLLGDPALPWSLVPDTMSLSLEKSALEAGDSLTVSGTTTPVHGGYVSIDVQADNQQWDQSVARLSDTAFSWTRTVKDSAVAADGYVRAFAWNDTAQVRGWTHFSKDTIVAHAVTMTPSEPFFGDSVSISCRLDVPAKNGSAAVYCLYAIANPHSSPILFDGEIMNEQADGSWRIMSPIPLDFSGDLDEHLLIKFNIVANNTSKTSRVHRFLIRGRPDLRFSGDSLRIRWRNDSLSCETEVLNAGNFTAPTVEAGFFWGTSVKNDTIAFFTDDDSLAPGKTKRISFTIPDTAGTLTFSGHLNISRAFPEISRLDNQITGRTVVRYGALRNTTDTLLSTGGGCVIVPARRLAKRTRIFLFGSPAATSAPLGSSSAWLALYGDEKQSFRIYSRPALSGTDSLHWTFRLSDWTSALSKKAAAKNGSMVYCTFAFDSTTGKWSARSAPENNASASSIPFTTTGSEGGPFAAGSHDDASGPDIRLSVSGREVTFLDYAAKDKPFIVDCRDPSGIVPSSVTLSLNGSPVDSADYARSRRAGDYSSYSITLYPEKEKRVDTLTVTARDFAGNTSEESFAYLPGENLNIRYLRAHPNPFTAEQNSAGETIHSIRIAFLLTDLADDVTLSIYTIAGRKIRSWRFFSMIGYQEVEWDGKSADGHRLANGTYYLKLVASNERKKTKKITPIAKLEGY